MNRIKRWLNRRRKKKCGSDVLTAEMKTFYSQELIKGGKTMSKPKFKNGDMVRILDGSKIENYVGHWVGKDDVLIKLFGEPEVETMEDHIGKIGTIKDYEEMSGGRIAYTLKEFGSLRWDERGLELVAKYKPYKDPFSEIDYQPPEKYIRLMKEGIKREYRIIGTESFFEKLEAFLKENEDECYAGWLPHAKDFHDWL